MIDSNFKMWRFPNGLVFGDSRIRTCQIDLTSKSSTVLNSDNSLQPTFNSATKSSLAMPSMFPVVFMLVITLLLMIASAVSVPKGPNQVFVFS